MTEGADINIFSLKFFSFYYSEEHHRIAASGKPAIIIGLHQVEVPSLYPLKPRGFLYFQRVRKGSFGLKWIKTKDAFLRAKILEQKDFRIY